MIEEFKDKVALVTGAAQRIGLATAKAFAQAGGRVIIADYNEKRVNESAKNLYHEVLKH